MTRTALNLTHRDGHEKPRALEPGERNRIRLDLDATSWVYEPGHRIRLDLAGADWPSVWAPPSRGTLTVDRSATTLYLPSLEGDPPIPEPPKLPAGDPEPAGETPPPIWRFEHDVLARTSRLVIEHAHERDVGEGPDMQVSYSGETGVHVDDPARAWSEGRVHYSISWPQATVRTEAHGRLESDELDWHLLLELHVSEGDELVHVRRWDQRWARNLQ